MNEAEFDRLLGLVCVTMSGEEYDSVSAHEEIMVVPVAANDNDDPWPLLPFPDGWVASC